MKKEKTKKRKKKGFLRLFRWGSLLPIALLLAAGVALFAVPAEKESVLGIATGVALALVAVLLIVAAFLGRGGVLQIVCAAGLIALAVWLFVQSEGTETLYYVLTGVVLLRALVGLFYALFAKRKESRLWQISMAGSILLLVAAVVYFFLPMLHMGGQSLLIGGLCCLNALFEGVALLHRITASMQREEPREKSKKKGTEEKTAEKAEEKTEEKTEEKKKKKKAKEPAPEEPQKEEPPKKEEPAPEEPQEEEKKPSFFARFRSKKN